MIQQRTEDRSRREHQSYLIRRNVSLILFLTGDDLGSHHRRSPRDTSEHLFSFILLHHARHHARRVPTPRQFIQLALPSRQFARAPVVSPVRRARARVPPRSSCARAHRASRIARHRGAHPRARLDRHRRVTRPSRWRSFMHACIHSFIHHRLRSHQNSPRVIGWSALNRTTDARGR